MNEKRPFVTLEKIQQICERFPPPFHLYDEAGIRANAQNLKDAFSWNHGFREYFAVKANPNPFLIQILREYGFGCDCSSLNELKIANALGCHGSEIMFSSNDTPAEEYAYVNQLGGIINLDDITHIPFLYQLLKGFPKTVCLRYNPGGEFETENAIMGNPADAKYGMTKEQIFRAVSELKEHGVSEFGLHAFLASNMTNPEYYPLLSKTLFELAVELNQKLHVHISFINLSGGIGIPYRPEEQKNNILEIGKQVHQMYDKILTRNQMGDVAIYTELGRFMMGPYGCIVTKAIHKKHIYKDYIGCDACSVDLLRPAMYGAYHHITVAGKENSACTHTYDVTGALCENNDKFAIDRKLPEVEIGDYLVIHDTGAHGYSMGYNYNGRMRSAEILLREDSSFELIRRAETSKDYFATFDSFPIYKKLIQ